MRELKFRAWTRQNPSMPWSQKFVAITGNGEQMIPIGGTFTGVWHALGDDDEGLVIEQFTGLKDKNGKEIYEGDILLNKNLNEYYEVAWDDEDYQCWSVVFRKEHNIPEIYPLAKIHCDVCSVVGNIHDDPELLKGEK